MRTLATQFLANLAYAAAGMGLFSIFAVALFAYAARGF